MHITFIKKHAFNLGSFLSRAVRTYHLHPLSYATVKW